MLGAAAAVAFGSVPAGNMLLLRRLHLRSLPWRCQRVSEDCSVAGENVVMVGWAGNLKARVPWRDPCAAETTWDSPC